MAVSDDAAPRRQATRPPFPRIRHVNRWLMVQHPLLWRSGLLPLAVICLPLALLAWALGMAQSMTPATVWTAAGVDNAVVLADVAAALLAATWLWRQARYPLGEVGAWRLLIVGVCTAIGLAMLLTPALLLRGTLNWQVAKAMPADEFRAHWELHASHGFWCCSNEFPRELDQERQASLQRFGLTTKGEPVASSWGDKVCPAEARQCLLTYDAAGIPAPRLLGERLRNVSAQQAIGATTPLAMVSTSGLAERLALALTMALVAVLASVPRHVWVRRFVWIDPLSGHRHLDLRLWLPGWLRRLDRRLLLNRPMTWATRVHVFVYHTLTIGAVLYYVSYESDFFIEGLLWQLSSHVPLLYMLFITEFWAALGGFVWILARRHWRIPATTPIDLRRLLGTFALGNLPISLFLILWLLRRFAVPTGAMEIWMAVLVILQPSLHVVCWALVDNYSRVRITVFTAVVGVLMGWPLLLFPVVAASMGTEKTQDLGLELMLMLISVGVVFMVGSGLYLSMWCRTRRRHQARPVSALRSALLINMLPAHILVAFLAVSLGAVLVDETAALSISGSLLLILILLTVALLFRWAILAPLTELARCSFEPRSD